MAYMTQNFQPLSMAQVSPLGYALQQGLEGLDQGVDLRKKMIETQIENYKKKYAPLTLQADAASKLAYANLMGPQFIAKILGNPDLLSNIPDEQKRNLLNFTTNAGTTSPLDSSRISSILNNKNIDTSKLSPQDMTAISKQRPGDAYTIPQQINTNPELFPQKTFAENVGEYQGVKEEGKKSGELRANDIQELGRQIESGYNISDKFNSLNNLINNESFRSLRSIPGFNSMQLKVLRNYGTPQQQELIGQFENAVNEIIRDTISSFPPGKILKGELDLSKNMKPSDHDSINVLIGKARSAEIYKELKTNRAQLTSDLMEDHHISKTKAEEIANKQLNAQSIINDINKKLDYSVQIRNKKTGQIESVPVSVARQRGVPGV